MQWKFVASTFVLIVYHSLNFWISTHSPSAVTGVAVVIFIFTSMVFIFYDCLVERRQRKVYSSAVRNNAIVSSLFPKNGMLILAPIDPHLPDSTRSPMPHRNYPFRFVLVHSERSAL